MNEHTLVAVYDTADQANAAVRDLEAANVPASAIGQHARNGSVPGATSTEMEAPVREKGFWASLFGGEPDYDTSVYDRSIDSGSTVVTVRVPGEQFDRISEILENHDPVDLDERTARYGSSETTTTTPASNPQATATAATEGDTIQLVEKTLSVGKRAVSGGTTRIRRHVVETPVRR